MFAAAIRKVHVEVAEGIQLGGRPAATSMLEDARKLFAQLQALFTRHGIEPRKLIVMGRSVGSAAALECAYFAGAKIDGLILDS